MSYDKVGIVGFGVVGKSVLRFFETQKDCDFLVDIWDKKDVTLDVKTFEHGKVGQVFSEANQPLEVFIKSHDRVVVSPGINLNNFYDIRAKFVCELDIFDTFFKKPVIAITGSLGKTTTTKLIGKLCSVLCKSDDKLWIFNKQKELNPFIGGNVGLGMLDAVGALKNFDLGVLEISSFQLEFNKFFAPHIAILTNCYPNHLDRHESLQNYLQAKMNLLKFQKPNQYAVISEQLLSEELLPHLKTQLANIESQINFTFVNEPKLQFLNYLNLKNVKMFYKHEDVLVYHDLTTGFKDAFFDMSALPDVTFSENWVQIISALYLLKADMNVLQNYLRQVIDEFEIDDHHHRLEYFATVDGVDFYDDSKATVIQSTLAATKKLAKNGPVILILGGLGKGVDRSTLCNDLVNISNLKKTYCFGPECKDFEKIACKLGTLEEVIGDIKKIMRSGDQVVLSPSGTSFDFFQNYKQRGQAFKDLIKKL